MATLIPEADIRTVQTLLNTHVGTFTKVNMQLQSLLERQADINSEPAAQAYLDAAKADALVAAQALIAELTP